MAFDISTGGRTPEIASAPLTFEDFYVTQADPLARALLLACNDPALAKASTEVALVKTAQRWKQVKDHPEPLGWAFSVGLTNADKTLSERAPLAMNAATGGYVRGLPLAEAVAALPLQQRAAVVASLYLGWSDQQAAGATSTRVDAVTTRRSRGVSFVAHHLRIPDDEANGAIREHLRALDAVSAPRPPSGPEVRRLARRRTWRNRVGALLAGAAVIVIGAGAIEVGTRTPDPVAVGPVPINGPTNSSDWLPPISDGRGGFMALNTRGASVFARSDDGVTWFEHTTWNSRAVDIRTEVTSFIRSGDRYITTIEAAPSINGAVPPRVAISTNLRDWTVAEIELDLLDPPLGLETRAQVVSAAAVGARVVVAVQVAESVDYQSLGINRQQVCVEALFDSVRALYLCDGGVVNVDRPADLVAGSTRYFLSEAGAPFVSISLPASSDARSLVSLGDRFAITDENNGTVSFSPDGEQWFAQSRSLTNRFALLAGAADGQALVVRPLNTGWGSALIDSDDEITVSSIGLVLDPTVVWSVPDLSAGPAGWALFVTTSRPWDRAGVTPGWAVDTGFWVVSRLPDTETITAQDRRRGVTYRFDTASDALEIDSNGGVVLSLPDSQGQVEITAGEIERSRSVEGQGRAKAQVFFSADGQNWRPIWESNEDAWFGSVSVGDEEVLVNGTSLAGGPIAVPLG